MQTSRILTALAITTFLLLAFAPTATAHASQNSADGKVRVTWGLLSEPGYTHEKNRLDLILRDPATGAGLGGAESAGLHIELKYGDEEYDLGNVTVNRGAKGSSFAGVGNYTSQHYLYLTRAGIYTLHISGTFNGSEIDLEIPATHEYGPMSDIMFPDEIEIGGGASTDLSAIEARLAALEAKSVTQSQTPATLVPQTPTTTTSKDAPALGVLILAAAFVAVALVRRRA